MGGGRTVPFLTRISADYTAVDYTPELVETCRLNHPGVRVHHMDARNMATFADNTFALVTFSFNGIASIGHGPGIDRRIKKSARHRGAGSGIKSESYSDIMRTCGDAHGKEYASTNVGTEYENS
jgi:Methyltransferase domain